MADLTLEELAESYITRAADCARWAREAWEKRKAAETAGDEAEADKQKKTAKMWSDQARQLRCDAKAMRGGPTIGISGRGGSAKKSTPPRPF